MYLRCVVQDAPKTWTTWLSLAELWYNSTYHTSLGCSPFKALYGVEANIGIPSSSDTSTPITVTELIENREFHLQSLKQHLVQAQNRMKTMSGKKRYLQFQVGDKVLLKLQPYTIFSAEQTISQTCLQVLWSLQGSGVHRHCGLSFGVAI